ncbi:E3 ubiquitin-protein ligase AIRP2 [Ricinus communis]|uniref:Protein binding protein, putative n=1 Tax=Ricinus communis TaxID=3988 RepID=B9RMQ0_RICCO|nr:E3 ubiquitin-protein ligase AIRP2 [Ricinus communis]EEF47573.1 protein binding protein, putative [Ricinus communis]|eukprot:XP_002515019.1 E3 ubiquitin-protein ligase AIRP2 [Ricinus communis]
MWQKQPNNKSSSFRESLKALEADIQHANTLAAAIPGDYGGDRVQMRLSYSPLAPFILFLVEWMDYSCTDALPSYLGLLHILVYKVYVDGMPTLSSKERKATLREFYATIYPSLRLLEGEFIELEDNPRRSQWTEAFSRKRVEDKRKRSDYDIERDDECGICMEDSAKMVLPNCGHSLCISCFHDWNTRSQSCPFCRGSLKRVKSLDLWVLINNSDIIDTVTIARENLRRFYLYIEKLPLLMPETHAILFDYMI